MVVFVCWPCHELAEIGPTPPPQAVQPIRSYLLPVALLQPLGLAVDKNKAVFLFRPSGFSNERAPMLTHLYVTSVAQVLSSSSSDTKVKSLFQDTLIQMLRFSLSKVDKLIQDFIVTFAFITAAITGKLSSAHLNMTRAKVK